MNKNIKTKLVSTLLTGAMIFGISSPAIAAPWATKADAVNYTVLNVQNQTKASTRMVLHDFEDGTWDLKSLDIPCEGRNLKLMRTIEDVAYAENAKFVEVGRKDLPINLGNVIIYDVELLSREVFDGWGTDRFAVLYAPLVGTGIDKGLTFSELTVGAMYDNGAAGATHGVTNLVDFNSLNEKTEPVIGRANGLDIPNAVAQVGQKVWTVVNCQYWESDAEGYDVINPIIFVADRAGSIGNNYRGIDESLRYDVKAIRFHDEDVSYRKPVTVPMVTEEEPSSGITIKLNNVDIKVDPAKLPFVKDGSTMVPLRTLAESMGLEVEYTPAAITLITGAGENVVVYVDSNKVERKGETVTIAGQTSIVNGTTYMPLRGIAEALGCEVGYDAATKTVSVTA